VDPIDVPFLIAAAFAAGAINAVAGGGSLVSFPALIAVGVPSKAANVTNTVALWPGYLGGSLGYRNELRLQRKRVIGMLPASVAGAIAGSVILLETPQSAFDAFVPFLILFACGVMAVQDQLGAFARRQRFAADGDDAIPWMSQIAVFFMAVYGAYFGAGLGILLLAMLTIFVPDDIQHSNALKGMLSLLINAIAVVYFAFFGPVRWAHMAVMAVAALAGGYWGVGIARRLGKSGIRIAVIVYGVFVAVVLLVT
jgi:uncharacterized membrane protein YfcA